MDQVVAVEERRSLSGKDIEVLTRDKANVIGYHELAHMSHLDEALGKHKAVVILYETKINEEKHTAFGHWVCLFQIAPDTLEFFDRCCE